MEQLGSLWTDFHEIWFGVFRKSVEKIHVWLKCDKILHEYPVYKTLHERPVYKTLHEHLYIRLYMNTLYMHDSTSPNST